MRPFRNGKGSYDLDASEVPEDVPKSRNQGQSYYVRGTFTHYNLDFAEDVLHLADAGLRAGFGGAGGRHRTRRQYYAIRSRRMCRRSL